MRLLHLPFSPRTLCPCSATATGLSAAANENGRRNVWIPARARGQSYRSLGPVVEAVLGQAQRITSCKTWCGTQRETKTCVFLSVHFPPPFCVISDAKRFIFLRLGLSPKFSSARVMCTPGLGGRWQHSSDTWGWKWVLRLRMRRNCDLADKVGALARKWHLTRVATEGGGDQIVLAPLPSPLALTSIFSLCMASILTIS